MPIDPSLVPALEQELEHAKKWTAGGQPPNKGRIAAIEAAIRKHRAAAKREAEVETADAEPAEPVEAAADVTVEDAAADAPVETTQA